MAKTILKTELSQKSLDELEKELINLEKALDKEIENSTKELGKKSLDYMIKQYQTSGKNGKKGMVGHIGKIKLRPYKKTYQNGFIISSGDDEIAVYNEFGTGIVGAENPNPLASDLGYQYNIGAKKGVPPEGAIKEYGREYCERVTTPDTWWYHKNNKWWHTEGMEGKGMYSSLVDKLNENAIKDFKANISQAIGEYKKHYNGR